MTPVPASLDKGTATPAERSALVSSLLVVLGAMRNAGMLGPVVSLLDCELPDFANGVELRPPVSLGPLATEAQSALK